MSPKLRSTNGYEIVLPAIGEPSKDVAELIARLRDAVAGWEAGAAPSGGRLVRMSGPRGRPAR